jgi:peptide deformylase
MTISEVMNNTLLKRQLGLTGNEAVEVSQNGGDFAAVQINELKKVVIVRNDFDNKEDRTFMVLINPVITKYEGKVVEDFERFTC